MTIEVKQMIIKSTVRNDRPAVHADQVLSIDIEKIKENLIEECRELINESLSDSRER
jgi:hypothetical protein